jgi:hypothetical protein
MGAFFHCVFLIHEGPGAALVLSSLYVSTNSYILMAFVSSSRMSGVNLVGLFISCWSHSFCAISVVSFFLISVLVS